MVKIKNLKKKVIALLPKRVTLIYIDYRDSIEDWDALNNAVKENDYQPLYEKLDDWIGDAQWDGVKCVKDELEKDVADEFDIEPEEAEEIVERYDDWIRDAIYNRDDSTPIKDLLRNTGDQVFFYDTGFTTSGYGESAAQYRMERMQVKRLLQIKDSTHDRDIDMMISQASYGTPEQLMKYLRLRKISDEIVYNISIIQ